MWYHTVLILHAGWTGFKYEQVVKVKKYFCTCVPDLHYDCARIRVTVCTVSACNCVRLCVTLNWCEKMWRCWEACCKQTSNIEHVSVTLWTLKIDSFVTYLHFFQGVDNAAASADLVCSNWWVGRCIRFDGTRSREWSWQHGDQSQI